MTCIGNSDAKDLNGFAVQSGTCKTCIEKYFLDNKQCIPCSSDDLCLECSSKYKCNKCVIGAKMSFLPPWYCYKQWKIIFNLLKNLQDNKSI